MRRLSALVNAPTMLASLILAVIILAAPLIARAETGGSILNMQGQTIPVDKFLNLVDTYVFVYDGDTQSVAMKDIASLTRTDSGIVVATRGGKTLTVTGQMAVALDPELRFATTNPVTGQADQSSIDPVLIKSISFN